MRRVLNLPPVIKLTISNISSKKGAYSFNSGYAGVLLLKYYHLPSDEKASYFLGTVLTLPQP